MPSFDFSIEESATSASGATFSIPDGWYVLKVVSMKTTTSNAGNAQVNLVWDVAEGPLADVAADNGWYDNKHTTYLQITGRAAGFTKRVLHMLAESNPGFRSDQAFLADDWPQFVGKVFGARIENGTHEYQGKTYRDMNVAEATTADAARSEAGTAAPTPPAQQAAPDLYSEDIPF